MKCDTLSCPGFFCVEGSSVPSPCPPGTIGLSAGRTSPADCSPCPSGFFCNESALTEPSGPCSPGLILLIQEENDTRNLNHEIIFIWKIRHGSFNPTQPLRRFTEMSDCIVHHRILLHPGVLWTISCLQNWRKHLPSGSLLSPGEWGTQTLPCWQLPSGTWSLCSLSVPSLPPRAILPQPWKFTTYRWGCGRVALTSYFMNYSHQNQCVPWEVKRGEAIWLSLLGLCLPGFFCSGGADTPTPRVNSSLFGCICEILETYTTKTTFRVHNLYCSNNPSGNCDFLTFYWH